MEKNRHKQTLWVIGYVYDLHYGDGVICVAYVQLITLYFLNIYIS